MKRIKTLIAIPLLTVLALALALSSCTVIPGYTEPEDQYIVSALGFDVVRGVLRVTAKVVSEDGSAGGKGARVFTGEGDTVEYAVSHLSGEGADEKRIETSHCAVIVVGAGVDKARLGEIFDFCGRNDDVTLAARVVSAYDAGELLGSENVDGYTLMNSLRGDQDGTGIGRGSRYYEIENARMGVENVFALPYFYLSESEFGIFGLKIYTDDSPRVLLDRRESAYYLILRGTFDRGVIDYRMPDGKSGSIVVKSCKTDYGTDGEIPGVICTLKFDPTLAPDKNTARIAEFCREGINDLYDELTTRYGDVFGFGKKFGRTDLMKVRIDVKEG